MSSAHPSPARTAQSPPPNRHAALSDDEPRRRVSKKLQKRRTGHTPTMELPERLKESTDGADDEEDVRVPTQGAGMPMNMNQSIFGLIAAAGSKVDFNDRFESQSSDEDEDSSVSHSSKGGRDGDLAQTTILSKKEGSKRDAHKRKLSGHRLLHSLPSLTTKLSLKHKKSSKPKTSQILEESAESGDSSPHPGTSLSQELSRGEGRLPPVMSRMLEAKAEMASRPSFDLERASMDLGGGSTGPSPLARRLKDIFRFDEPEEVIEEYPCWLLQSVLLQGYMYITSKHICFYAYLAKKAHEVAKSGYLSKSGKHNPAYNRYWFRLKGDVLAYYRDPSNLYFPSGQIDLRYGISASIVDKDKDGMHFNVVTHHRTYHFRADSAPSAKEWVKSLQRVIFRSHNEGDSIKISLPIQNVIDVEEAQMIDFADTCKVRVIDNDETYAIDEYFFSFFDHGAEAVNVLKILVDDAAQQAHQERGGAVPPIAEEEYDVNDQASSKKSSPNASKDRLTPLKIGNTKLNDSVRATLSPLSPASPRSASPRPSGEMSRSSFDAFRPFGRRSVEVGRALREDSPRRSFSDSRRSLSRNRLGDRTPTEKHGSSDSYVQSLEEPSQASLSALVASSSEDPTASQILRGSDVFHRPTVQRSASASRRREQDPVLGSEAHKPRSPRLQPYRPKHAATTGSVADHPGELGDMQTPTTPTLQNLAKMGSYPLQRAGLYAGWLNKQSRRMSNLLATESMGYVEKVSGMWKGGKRHYDEPAGLRTDDELDDEENDKVATSMERFRAHFALPESERLQATYFGFLMRVLPLYGKIYISDRSFCFRSLLPGTRTKLILPLKDIENVDKEKGFRFGYSGLVVVIRGHEELFFEFNQAEARDDCAITLLQNLEAVRYLRESGILGQEEKEDAEEAIAERDALQEARKVEYPDHEVKLPRDTSGVCADSPTILFDDPKASFLNFKPTEPLRITCLTIGSRGDVQPYIALCKGLLAEGHKVRIATHAEFEDWIRGHGIDFRCVEGDPGELMKLCIENGTFTLQFLKEANSKMRSWLDELLTSAWTACQDSDLLVESPSAMAGIHIAEALQIPYFRAFTMPWTRTRAYPHAFVTPEHKMGGAYNYVTYVMFDNVFWKATAHQINRWRNKTLGLPNTNMEKMQPNKVPFLYNFSPYVVPPPLDFSDWIRVTGYWFLDEGTGAVTGGSSKDGGGGGDRDEGEGNGEKTAVTPPPTTTTTKPAWMPPADLTAFIDKARQDDKKIVYVGFGSILVPDPAKMTQEVIDAVLKADVRCILSKGWSDRIVTAKEKEKAAQGDPAAAAANDASKPEVPLPPEIFQIKSAPHDWLFAQIDAAAHHGGSGTTGASLRAGVPTIIRPFFGDQFFFGARVEDLGVGICLRKWGANSFARALWEATHSERMIVKARVLGEQIRKENGVDTAIQCIYRDLEYAKSLVKAKASKNAAHQQRVASAAGGAGGGGGALASASSDATDADDEDDDVTEESWTFVGAGAGGFGRVGAAAEAGDANSTDADSLMGMRQSVILSPEGAGADGGHGQVLGSRALKTGL
ncbi:uncharacterized protein E0L32_000833 [Thyridium curvatum]|uniref:Sterol 3-beta-glucosyltransferase n=1 Tax=Thyridium curvatum TaxID=1093900 RepID=A0A507B0U7_9PEZI|nr:uncharacterized protein E0L32_000833 [Thyridium curvatum]TPX12656.1 hypothetical protein E0L32_000833 [Thyridium curvatum]